MPFSGRLGFQFVQDTTPAEPEWYELSKTDVSNVVSTFSLTGTRSYTSYDIGSTIWNGQGAYRGPVAGPNGNVYLCPSAKSTNSILEYDPVNQVATEIDSGETLSGNPKYIAGALGPDNKIYWAPHSMDKFLIYDVDAGTFELQDWGITFSGFNCEFARFAGDKLYCIGSPANAVIVNTTANTAVESNLGLSLGTNNAKYVSGVRSIADDCIYAGGYDNGYILKIDPTTDTATQNNYGGTYNNKSQGITNGKNGNLYIMAHTGSNAYEFDPVANTLTAISGATTTMGAAMGTDGNVYAGAWSSTNFMDVTIPSITTNPSYMPNGQQRWGSISIGNTILQFGHSNTHVAHIDAAGSGDGEDLLQKITLTNYYNKDR